MKHDFWDVLSEAEENLAILKEAANIAFRKAVDEEAFFGVAPIASWEEVDKSRFAAEKAEAEFNRLLSLAESV